MNEFNRSKKIELRIRNEMLIHPQSTLIDIYKLFFQGTFGAGHFITNKKNASIMLQQELNSATKFDHCVLQNVGYFNDYFRVNMVLLKRNEVSFEQYLNLFLRSSNVEKNISRESWTIEWEKIFNLCNKLIINRNNFEKELRQINKSLRSENALVSHSKAFSRLYHPHYRIIKGEFLKELFDGYFTESESN